MTVPNRTRCHLLILLGRSLRKSQQSRSPVAGFGDSNDSSWAGGSRDSRDLGTRPHIGCRHQRILYWHLTPWIPRAREAWHCEKRNPLGEASASFLRKAICAWNSAQPVICFQYLETCLTRFNRRYRIMTIWKQIGGRLSRPIHIIAMAGCFKEKIASFATNKTGRISAFWISQMINYLGTVEMCGFLTYLKIWREPEMLAK